MPSKKRMKNSLLRKLQVCKDKTEKGFRVRQMTKIKFAFLMKLRTGKKRANKLRKVLLKRKKLVLEYWLQCRKMLKRKRKSFSNQALL